MAKIPTRSPLSRISNLKRSPELIAWEHSFILRRKKTEEAHASHLREQAQNAEDARNLVLKEREEKK